MAARLRSLDVRPYHSTVQFLSTRMGLEIRKRTGSYVLGILGPATLVGLAYLLSTLNATYVVIPQRNKSRSD